MNDQCLNKVGEFRVALSKTERNVQRLFSLKQAQIPQNNHDVHCLR